MKRLVYILCSLLVGIVLTSCNVTSLLQPNTYLLQRVKIEEDKSTPRDERISSEDLSRFTVKPNKRFIGTDFYTWVYLMADPQKQDSWWNNLKLRIGEAPVLLNEAEVKNGADNIKQYLNTRGFYSSEVSYSINTTYRYRRAKVYYTLKQGKPYIIDSVSYKFKDKPLEPVILSDTANTLLHKGTIFDLEILSKERERINRFLRDRGFYYFSVDNINFLVDTLSGNQKVDLTIVIDKNKIETDSLGRLLYGNNAVYRLKNIRVIPTNNYLNNTQNFSGFDSLEYRGLNILYNGNRPKIRQQVLRGIIPIYPNYLYNLSQVEQTYSRLMKMAGLQSARIEFVDTKDSNNRDMVTLVDASKNGGYKNRSLNYFYEKYLDCNIYYTPALKQGIKAELEASTTSSFYGLTALVGYQNRNIFRGAEMLELTGIAGYEYMKAPNSKKRHAMEFGIKASLSFPRFLLANYALNNHTTTPRTKFEISYNYQDRPYYRRGLSSISWMYSWSNLSNSSYTIRPIAINWIDVSYIDEKYYNSLQNQYLKHSFESQLIVAIQGSYQLKKQYKSAPNNQTTVLANCELSGNLLNGLVHLFSKPVSEKNYYEFLGIRYSQYIRTDINASHRVMLGKVTAIAARLYAGVAYAYGNSNAVPFDRLFYCGGSNSMRGWAPRTLGPGSSLAPTNVVYPTQLGDIKLEANLEFRFPIWDMFHGATFFDLGNIWYIGRKDVQYPEGSVFHFNNFYKQLAFNTGIGLRLDIEFAILRLDWGIQLHNPNNPEGKRWIHNFKWRNTSLNFGVGFPF